MPKEQLNPDQETRNDLPLIQDQREQRADGERDQAEGDPSKTTAGERIPGADHAPEEQGSSDVE